MRLDRQRFRAIMAMWDQNRHQWGTQMKQKIPTNPSIVVWRDAWSSDNKFPSIEEAIKKGSGTCIRTEIGFVLSRDKDRLVMTKGYTKWPDEILDVDGVHHIPADMIIKIRKLEG